MRCVNCSSIISCDDVIIKTDGIGALVEYECSKCGFKKQLT